MPQYGSSFSRPIANPQGTLAHFWPPLGKEKHQLLPRCSTQSCCPRPPDTSQGRDTSAWWLLTQEQQKKLSVRPWGCSHLSDRGSTLAPVFLSLLPGTLHPPNHKGNLWCLRWNWHFSLHLPVYPIVIWGYDQNSYFTIQLHLLFKSESCLFLFSLQRAFLG